jgi:hypothetical protein
MNWQIKLECLSVAGVSSQVYCLQASPEPSRVEFPQPYTQKLDWAGKASATGKHSSLFALA